VLSERRSHHNAQLNAQHLTLNTGLKCEHVEVNGDGRHFEAIIVSALFRDKPKVRQHQLVYAALGDRMREEIHALSMKTLTPEEWQGRAV
jgi:acid stress-induced BolA-like protein IbaG/YrbA